MRYLPHTPAEIEEMLAVVGAETLDDLYASVPPGCRSDGPLQLPGPLTEWELRGRMAALAGEMGGGAGRVAYLGAGSYEHYIPQVVAHLAGRGEFVTAYTPYQPEVSQGTLQAVFEYQTLVCRLLGMDVANASLYDGASALAEALLLAVRVTRRRSVAVARSVHPFYRAVVRTYLEHGGYQVREVGWGDDGRVALEPPGEAGDLAALAVQSPNFFGVVEDLAAAAAWAREAGALSVAGFSEPLAYGVLPSPGSQGIDVACGEGQSLGLRPSFGGPGLGLFAAKAAYTRNLPGRVVGKTVDRDGRRGFVLTLSTREQHIRREKATSNICSNQNLCAVTAAIYLACLGREGIHALARLNHDKAAYLKGRLAQAGLALPFSGPTFNEFAVRFPGDAQRVHGRLLRGGVAAGVPLGRFYPELDGCYLLCVTETKSREQLDALAEGICA